MTRNPAVAAFVTVRRSLAICLPAFAMTIVTATLTHCSSSCHAQEVAGIVSWQQLETPTDDLIRLSTTYTDALKELKIARLSLDTLQTLRPNAVVTNLEIQIANLNLEAAERKVKLLRSIVEKQLLAAQNKLEIIKYLEARFAVPNGDDNSLNDRQYIRAQDEATVQILKMILEMQ
ncbi:MAG: hypothetical protein GY768_08975 [Planctomycetaceae bacterium]|nr:hypothetical protein [Planctomycetaceae bacterium]